MFSKKNATAQLEAPETVIGKGVYIEAVKMTGKESVRIDGSYHGIIDIEGSLILSDTSVVTGNVKAKYILGAGQVNGDITCESVLHLASTAKVNGDVKTKTLIVDEGCQINGRYQVGETAIVPEKTIEKTTEKSYLDKSFDLPLSYDNNTTETY